MGGNRLGVGGYPKVESYRWLDGGFGADVHMHGGRDLDRLESEGPWGRHGGPLAEPGQEPGSRCRAVDPSAYVPEGSLCFALLCFHHISKCQTHT